MAQGGTQPAQSASSVEINVTSQSPDVREAIESVLGTQHLDDADARLKTRDARYESLITTGYLRKANDAITVNTAGFSQVSVQLSGQWVGPLMFEATLDGNVWQPIIGLVLTASLANLPPGGVGAVQVQQPSGAQVSYATLPGIYKFGVSALKQFRVRATQELPRMTVMATVLLSAGPATFDVSQTILSTSQNVPLQQEWASGHLLVSDNYGRNVLDQILVELMKMNQQLATLVTTGDGPSGGVLDLKI